MAASSPFRSAVFRLTVLTVALLGLAAAAVVGLAGYMAGRDLAAATEAAIRDDLAALRQRYRDGGIDALAAAITERSQVNGPELYFLGDRAGRRRAGNLPALPGAESAEATGATFEYALPGRTRRTAAGATIDLGEGHVLVVGRDIEDQRRLIATLERGLLAGLGVLAAIGIGAGWLLARRILGRIEAISAASRAIMSGDLAERIRLEGTDDELDRLAAQLNTMLDRIERLMTGLREVSDNIAHDLKTPLNRLRNRAEAALGDPCGSAAWREGLERTIADADEIIKTFNALLLIARLEAGAMDETGEIVDATELAADVAELYAPAAEDHGFMIVVDAAEAAPVRGNRQLLGQSLANLIDNAVKHAAGVPGEAKPAGTIRISTRVLAGKVELSVADDGPGIAPGERARALERFGRLDRSRSRPGTGLGLSLVAAVARMHGGTFRLEDNRPGLIAILSLPAAAGVPRIEAEVPATASGPVLDARAKA